MQTVKHVATKYGLLNKMTGGSEVEKVVLTKRGVRYVVHVELRVWHLHLAPYGYDA